MRRTHAPFAFSLLRLFIFLTVASPIFARAYLIDDGEYEGAKAVVHEILDHAPLSENVIVGVGRSPTPFTTMLSILDPDSVANLPLTGASALKDGIDRSERTGAQFGDLAGRDRASLDKHFEMHLSPLIKRLHGRRIVFIDFVATGSFYSALQLLGDYLRRRHPEVSYDFIAIGKRANLERRKLKFPAEKSIYLDDKSPELTYRLLQSDYDRQKFSEYGEWGLRMGPAQKQENHLRYKREMFERMLRDGLTTNAQQCRFIYPSVR